MEQILETALVIRVPEADPFVRSVRDKYDPAAAGSIPAHITINYPFQPKSKVDSALFNRLSGIFSSIQPFDYTLNEVGRFPGALYLKPLLDDPFLHLINTVAADFPESPPYGGVHKDIIPHLTIAHSGFIEEYDEVVNEIENEIIEILPISSTASQVSYLEYQNDVWKERNTFDLGAS